MKCRSVGETRRRDEVAADRPRPGAARTQRRRGAGDGAAICTGTQPSAPPTSTTVAYRSQGNASRQRVRDAHARRGHPPEELAQRVGVRVDQVERTTSPPFLLSFWGRPVRSASRRASPRTGTCGRSPSRAAHRGTTAWRGRGTRLHWACCGTRRSSRSSIPSDTSASRKSRARPRVQADPCRELVAGQWARCASSVKTPSSTADRSAFEPQNARPSCMIGSGFTGGGAPGGV